MDALEGYERFTSQTSPPFHKFLNLLVLADADHTDALLTSKPLNSLGTWHRLLETQHSLIIVVLIQM